MKSLISQVQPTKLKSNLQGCGKEKQGNWEDFPQRAQNLINAIGNSGLKDSLNKISFYGCCLNEEKTKEIFI